MTLLMKRMVSAEDIEGLVAINSTVILFAAVLLGAIGGTGDVQGWIQDIKWPKTLSARKSKNLSVRREGTASRLPRIRPLNHTREHGKEIRIVHMQYINFFLVEQGVSTMIDFNYAGVYITQKLIFFLSPSPSPVKIFPFCAFSSSF